MEDFKKNKLKDHIIWSKMWGATLFLSAFIILLSVTSFGQFGFHKEFVWEFTLALVIILGGIKLFQKNKSHGTVWGIISFILLFFGLIRMGLVAEKSYYQSVMRMSTKAIELEVILIFLLILFFIFSKKEGK